MNSITIAGRVGKEPEIRHLQDGTPVLSFSVADDQGKDKQAIWWRCSLFGKRAESLQQYITKGGSVTVVGAITEREYTDKDGQKRKSQDVRVQDIALQGGRPQGDERPAPAPRQQPAQQGGAPGGFEDMEDDIPFISSSVAHDFVTSKQKRMGRYGG